MWQFAGVTRVVGTCVGDPVYLTICCYGAWTRLWQGQKYVARCEEHTVEVKYLPHVTVFDCVKLVVMVPL